MSVRTVPPGGEIPTFSEALPKKTKDAEVRERVYRAVSNEVREILAKTPMHRLNKGVGQKITEAITEILFTAAIKEGYFRFSDGFGSFRVARLKRVTQAKPLPGGGTVQLSPNRMKLRYEPGAAVREALGMPPQTTYVRRFERRSKLSAKTRALLDGASET